MCVSVCVVSHAEQADHTAAYEGEDSPSKLVRVSADLRSITCGATIEDRLSQKPKPPCHVSPPRTKCPKLGKEGKLEDLDLQSQAVSGSKGS